MRDDPGINLVVSQRNPMFNALLKGMGIMTEGPEGHLTLRRTADMFIPRLKMDVAVHALDGTPILGVVRYELRRGPEFGSMMEDIRFETNWYAQDQYGRFI